MFGTKRPWVQIPPPRPAKPLISGASLTEGSPAELRVQQRSTAVTLTPTPGRHQSRAPGSDCSAARPASSEPPASRATRPARRSPSSLDLGVAKDLHHDSRVDVQVDQQGRARPTSVVHRDRLDTRLAASRRELSIKAARFAGGARRACGAGAPV